MTKAFSLVLVSLLVAYSSAAILLENLAPENKDLEGFLCRFFLCDNDLLLKSAHEQLLQADLNAAGRSLPGFQEALRRNPASPYRWCDLGDALFQAGDLGKSRYCFDRAVELAPWAPPILMRAGGYYFSIGDEQEAMRLMARILGEIREYDGIIFSYYSQMETGFTEVLSQGVPPQPDPAQSFFRYLLRLGYASHYELAWDWILSHSLADDELAAGYVDFLLEEQGYELAAASWKRYAAGRGMTKPDNEHVWNRGFESEFTGSVFDWRIRRSRHATAERDSEHFVDGSWALKIQFDGEENLNYAHVYQRTVVEPGRYTFRVSIRANEVTTDQGVGFRIFDSEDRSRFDIATEQVVETTEWKRIEAVFTVPPETRLLEIQVVRPRSRKFDNRIGGSVWIDDASLVNEG